MATSSFESNNQPSHSFVCIGLQGSKELYLLEISKEGDVVNEHIHKVTYTPGPMHWDGETSTLFVGGKDPSGIYRYKVDITDDSKISLQPFGQLIQSMNASPTFITSQKDILFSAYYHEGMLLSHKLRDEADQHPIAPVDQYSGIEGCHSVYLSSDNSLYCLGCKEGKIYTIGFDPVTGEKLTQLHVLETNPGPRHMARFPNTPHVAVIHEYDALVSVHSTQPKLTEAINFYPSLEKKLAQGSAAWAADIHISRKHNFVFTCDRNESTITVFHYELIDSVPNLKLIDRIDAPTQPRSFALINDDLLIVVGQKSNECYILRVNVEKMVVQKINSKNLPAGSTAPMWCQDIEFFK